MEFLVECSTRSLTRLLCLLVSYGVEHEKRNSPYLRATMYYFVYKINTLPIRRSRLTFFTGQDFTAAQRERAQEDFKALFKGAPPHPPPPPPFAYERQPQQRDHPTLFSNSAWVLLRPTELSTLKEFLD